MVGVGGVLYKILHFKINLFKVLRYTAGHINYGGRVTDDLDRRTMMNILNDYYTEKVLNAEHIYSKSGVYRQIDPETDHNVR